ncbi:MAG: asparagine synthetase B [Calditrichaeota bacterium]|nr:asparagine synthetase B [Calditrichota bacterium]
MRRLLLLLSIATLSLPSFAQKLLIPMDLSQTDHLKAYGIAYDALEKGIKVEWLLNYRGGSFMMDYDEAIASDCRLRGVSAENAGGAGDIYLEIENANMEVVLLEKATKVAIYAPDEVREGPWDDAVNLALTYAEIPFDVVYDRDILEGKLSKYEWIHLHHEDFTGQYGKFYSMYRNADWYVRQVQEEEASAKSLGFSKVSEMKLAVARTLKSYMGRGGFLFAMCSATDSYDISLAAAATDICAQVFDGDGIDPNYASKMDFGNALAFQNYNLITDPMVYEFSSIDVSPTSGMLAQGGEGDYFTLFDFSAKFDPVPTMLTQCHTNVVKGFLGQTTAFHKEYLRPSVTVLAQREGTDEIKYVHGKFGEGFWTFYGGHDPEDYRHQVGDPPTNLALHKNSPGYRLILNNVLFPAARKKELKT